MCEGRGANQPNYGLFESEWAGGNQPKFGLFESEWAGGKAGILASVLPIQSNSTQNPPGNKKWISLIQIV